MGNVEGMCHRHTAKLWMIADVLRRVVEPRRTLSHDMLRNEVDPVLMDGSVQVAMVGISHSHSPGTGGFR